MAAQKKDSIIYWSENLSLTWKDFEGRKIDSTETAAATSVVQIQILPSLKSNGNYNCLFFATFHRKKSFSISRDLNLLKHEQIHFDIQELFARKIRKYFKRLIQLDPTNAQICSNAFFKYFKELNSYQELYDHETKGSRQKNMQQHWNLKISKELRALEEFSVENLYEIDHNIKQ